MARNLHSSHFPVCHTCTYSWPRTVGTRQLITWWIMNSTEGFVCEWVAKRSSLWEAVRDKMLGNESIKKVVLIVWSNRRSQLRRVSPPPQLSALLLNQLFPQSTWPENSDTPLTSDIHEWRKWGHAGQLAARATERVNSYNIRTEKDYSHVFRVTFISFHDWAVC